MREYEDCLVVPSVVGMSRSSRRLLYGAHGEVGAQCAP